MVSSPYKELINYPRPEVASPQDPVPFPPEMFSHQMGPPVYCQRIPRAFVLAFSLTKWRSWGPETIRSQSLLDWCIAWPLHFTDLARFALTLPLPQSVTLFIRKPRSFVTGNTKPFPTLCLTTLIRNILPIEKQRELGNGRPKIICVRSPKTFAFWNQYLRMYVRIL